MAHPIEWLRLFVVEYPSFQYISIFLAALFGGELALFGLGFLAAQGVFPVLPVIILSFTGGFTPNILWFLLGQTATAGKIASHKYTNSTTAIIVEAITRVSGGSHLVGIIIAKFLVGTPVILMMYVNKTAMTFKKFIYYETVAILLSLAIILPIGFISGLGFSYLAQNLENLYVALGFVLLVVTVVIVAQIWFEKIFTRTPKL
ncbi:hypothetical protein A2W67_01855 [Candidatus Nomurabacteria bacterium RIFCSPLOWO2_02_40_28]|uniref:DedA family protein n=2 Tax=Candidatus Nomuraibacteriota TaxID=1752729 RepID=A0A837HQW1_9BACT|nr:MAG: hypothetical protein UT27_C0005G0021 [Candidatus Nomurabacteria bacterium GW2011_GWD2_39_12]KKR20287.1 MAG: hypothetical protein UT51_C0005G0020 [Candidatus Nomurabacteria bacterium GW2011_GWC2_39_41]KKR36533.1 MAG: hypothetical protein UT70_C0010G0020 [Candidatus Nomurabacteria bacterium GW2011_GWE2_40_10]KKR38380.1 MAG: hypothetical protein UT73_C0003G0020 [Candidatus Nomurabacteria bacterium GW2011_GWB1_40_11]KKR39879.1 MAG: hypothetical protein UT74_C0005G0096 [Parcubacteria group b